MGKPLNKELYIAARKKYKEPIVMFHALYNMNCDPQFKLPSIGSFEGMFSLFFNQQGFKLMQGVLILRNNFDKKFGYIV